MNYKRQCILIFITRSLCYTPIHLNGWYGCSFYYVLISFLRPPNNFTIVMIVALNMFIAKSFVLHSLIYNKTGFNGFEQSSFDKSKCSCATVGWRCYLWCIPSCRQPLTFPSCWNMCSSGTWSSRSGCTSAIRSCNTWHTRDIMSTALRHLVLLNQELELSINDTLQKRFTFPIALSASHIHVYMYTVCINW